MSIMIILTILTVALCNSNYIVMFKRNDKQNRITAKQALEDNVFRTTGYFGNMDKIHHYVSNGYVARLDDTTASKIREDPHVQLVERDQVIKIADYKVFNVVLDVEANKKSKLKMQYNAPWGISRIIGMDYLRNHTYLYPSNSGENVEVYVIDTGIKVDHPEFQGRARWGINLVDDTQDKDDNGHGTHCAGIIGSRSFGIAKRANLIAVKVLDVEGSGMISKIISGIDFVINEHEAKKDLLYDIATAKFINEQSTPESSLNEKIDKFINNSDLLPKTVVNMSVGGEKSAALNFALDYASSLGIHFAVAAGNDHKNACEYSPGSSSHSVTTGASTRKDTTAEFSNFGSCVDLYAPGVEIISTWNDGGSRLASGTSMATPHTSGAMALYLSSFNYTPEKLKKTIVKDTQNAIRQDIDNGSFLSRIWPIDKFFNKKKLPLLSIRKLLDRVENIN